MRHFIFGLRTLYVWIGSLGLLLATPLSAAPINNPGSQDIRHSGFVYCVNGMVDTFNPQKASSGLIIDTLAAQLYDRLLNVDPYTYRLSAELAQSWETLDEGATYRFHLRKNVPFQTTAWFTPTRPMNADDVVFSLQRVVDQKNHYHSVNGETYPYFDSLQFGNSIKRVSKLDNYTVEIQLNQPDASFLWHLATHYAPVLSAEYADMLQHLGKEEQIDRQPVGTGQASHVCSRSLLIWALGEPDVCQNYSPGSVMYWPTLQPVS
jgi:cationic peptide transport system substrate-binding protein